VIELATADDLRAALGLTDSTFNLTRGLSAVRRASAVVLAHAGAHRVAGIANLDDPRLAVAESVTLAYAARLYANPEAVLQRRLGSDYSVSFADSSSAATGLTRDELTTLRLAFGSRSTTLRG
jgi:hypothetical protein